MLFLERGTRGSVSLIAETMMVIPGIPHDAKADLECGTSEKHAKCEFSAESSTKSKWTIAPQTFCKLTHMI